MLLAVGLGLLLPGPALAQDDSGEEDTSGQEDSREDSPGETDEAPPPDASPLPAPRPEPEPVDEDGDGVPDDPLSPHRTRFDVLMDRTIGTASRPTQLDWRKTRAQVAVLGSYYLELNTFNSARVGGLGRFPTSGALVELGASYTTSWDSRASRDLALTPYRQPGRPSRLEIDLNVGLPLAEGIVTPQLGLVPAAQLVLMGYVGVRYNLYPTGFRGLRRGQVATAIFEPGLRDAELDNLEDARLRAMQVDPGRYGLLVGLGNDVYFKQGLFLSPRVQFAIPLLQPVSNTNLPFWVDLSMAVGVAF